MKQLDFPRIIAEHLEQLNSEDPHPRQVGVYHASELGAECLRQLHLRYLHPDKKPSPFTLGVFKMGDLIHKWLGEVFKERFGEVNVELEVEVPTYVGEGFEVHGRADVVRNRCFVVDFKTCTVNAFKYGDLPDDSHTTQLNFYLHQLGIDEGAVLYVEKYALRAEPRPVEHSLDLLNESIRKIRRLHWGLLGNRLPERHYNFPSLYPCTCCNYKEECRYLEG
jgi:hypothetical protein